MRVPSCAGSQTALAPERFYTTKTQSGHETPLSQPSVAPVPWLVADWTTRRGLT